MKSDADGPPPTGRRSRRSWSGCASRPHKGRARRAEPLIDGAFDKGEPANPSLVVVESVHESAFATAQSCFVASSTNVLQVHTNRSARKSASSLDFSCSIIVYFP